MPRNIEIKARIDSIESMVPKIAALTQTAPMEFHQDDTFFACQTGRLKLRVYSDSAGELIYYRRSDQAGPKESYYLVTPTAAPYLLRECLSLACGQVGRVRKHRLVFLVGRTRIHLDRVQGLGNFMELEVVLSEGEPSEAGVAVAHELLAKLGIASTQLIEGAYIDLLNAERKGELY
jgi:predicted adenylyl cyclase CyaB